jgi:hypothetical protein
MDGFHVLHNLLQRLLLGDVHLEAHIALTFPVVDHLGRHERLHIGWQSGIRRRLRLWKMYFWRRRVEVKVLPALRLVIRRYLPYRAPWLSVT